MALPDLTGQNIQDTYKRVLTVGDNGLMYDGTGSLFTPLSASSIFIVIFFRNNHDQTTIVIKMKILHM